jgi:hypothetical protein
MTHHETERLKQLCSCPVEELAAFINRLSAANEEVDKAVSLFLLRNDTKRLAKQIQNRIAGIKRRTSFIGYRYAGEMADNLNAILDVIENDLLPSAPLEALRLLFKFIETDEPVLNRADDSDGMIGDAYHRACRLFGAASKAAGQPQEAEELFMQLRKGDGQHRRNRENLLAAVRTIRPSPARAILSVRYPGEGKRGGYPLAHESRIHIETGQIQELWLRGQLRQKIGPAQPAS